MACCSFESQLRERLRKALTVLECRFPSIFFTADFWRYESDNHSDYPDDQNIRWYRLHEGISVAAFKKQEKYSNKEVGLLIQTVHYMITVSELGLKTGDHVIYQGTSHLITDCVEQSGLVQLRIEEAKSIYTRPGRFDPVNRQTKLRAVIL